MFAEYTIQYNTKKGGGGGAGAGGGWGDICVFCRKTILVRTRYFSTYDIPPIAQEHK